LLRRTPIAIIVGSVLAPLPPLAQESSPYQTDRDFDASLPSTRSTSELAGESSIYSAAYKGNGFIQSLIGFEASLRSANLPPNVADESQEAVDEKREFIQRLNGLASALNDFTAAYKSGVVDYKKVKELRKALQELQKSEWFKPQKAK
jgi:hypothetical protein